MMSSVVCAVTSIRPVRDDKATRSPSEIPRIAASRRLIEQNTARGPLHQAGGVVAPRVVRVQVTPPNQDQPVRRRRHPCPQPSDVVEETPRRGVDPPAAGAESLRKARRQRPEVDAVRRTAERSQREPLAQAADAVRARA